MKKKSIPDLIIDFNCYFANAWSTAPHDEKLHPGQQHQYVHSDIKNPAAIPPTVNHLSIDSADDEQSKCRYSFQPVEKSMQPFKRHHKTTPSDKIEELEAREALVSNTDNG
eukprot:2948685-Ditylum_brightwellii.AAC.1